MLLGAAGSNQLKAANEMFMDVWKVLVGDEGDVQAWRRAHSPSRWPGSAEPRRSGGGAVNHPRPSSRASSLIQSPESQREHHTPTDGEQNRSPDASSPPTEEQRIREYGFAVPTVRAHVMLILHLHTHAHQKTP